MYGRAVMDDARTATAAPDEHSREPEAGRLLSTRERQVLAALAAGQTGSEIAGQLLIAPDTVRRHVANARHKLQARTRAHAIAEALRRGEI